MNGSRFLAAKDNPFEMSRVERLLTYDPELIGADWESIEAGWESNARIGAVVGPHGSGKTAFLSAFGARLMGRGETVVELFFNRERRSWSPEIRQRVEAAVQRGSILLVDGYEQLTFGARRQLGRAGQKGGGLCVSSHRRTTFPTMLRTHASPEILVSLVERLSPETQLTERELYAIFDGSGGNLREALWSCYDHYAGI